MRSGRRGDMGFMEAMLSMMAVVTVLTAFVAASAMTVSVVSDPTEGLDADMLEAEVSGGELVPHYEGYLRMFLAKTGCIGVSVEASAPGFSETSIVTVGSMDGDRTSTTYVSLVPMEGGRMVPAVFEVTVCA